MIAVTVIVLHSDADTYQYDFDIRVEAVPRENDLLFRSERGFVVGAVLWAPPTPPPRPLGAPWSLEPILLVYEFKPFVSDIPERLRQRTGGVVARNLPAHITKRFS